MKGLLDPKMDFVFKNIFGSEKNSKILISFLNATLKPKYLITAVEIKNTDINKVLNDEKLTVRVNRAITKIDYKDILYITYDSYRRKSVIMTTNDEYEVNEPLNAIYKRLIGDFKYTHRACITNMNNVVKIDPKERVIIFKNGQTTDLLSRNYKKEVKQDACN